MYASGILPYDIGVVTYVWKITMHLYETVDPDILSHAAHEASKRYPYFLKRLVKRSESYEIVDNNLPLEVYDNTSELRTINHKSNNYHLMSVGYSGKSIDFVINHMLAGACGLVEWVKTVLYLYLCKKHDVELHVDGIKLPGQEIPEAERQFISSEVLEEADDSDALNIESVSPSENGELPFLEYALGIALPKLTKKVYFRFEFPQREFMQKARSFEASPVTLLSALMFKALYKAWPLRFKGIQGMITHNYRAEVGLPETTCDLVRYIHIPYPDTLSGAPLEKIVTVTRGQVLLQSDKAFALRDAKHVVDRIKAVDALPTLNEKKKYCLQNSLYGQQVIDSYQVSYVGRTDWGDMLPYIAAGDIVTEGHLMLEVLSVGDRFYASLLQEVGDEKYKDAFVKVLEEEGIVYSVSEAIDRRIPAFELPK